MKNRHYLVIIMMITILSSCLLTGCQLAKEDLSQNHNSDKLCGVFVTIGLDTNKLYQEMSSPAKVIINSKGKPELELSPLNDYKVEGSMSTDGSVKFGDIPGYYMGTRIVKDSKGGMVPTMSSDTGFYDVKVGVNTTDNSEDYSYEGTLSMSEARKDSIVHFNPVYQREDKSIYVQLAQSPGLSVSGNGSGETCSQSLSNETTSTNGRHVKKEKTSFKVNIKMVDEARKIMIKEMSKQDTVIKATEYFPDSSDEYVVSPNTCYIIVEEYAKNKENNITRTIYNIEGVKLEETYTSHVCNFPGKDSILGVKSVRFVDKKSSKK